jgi:hypothetical protein
LALGLLVASTGQAAQLAYDATLKVDVLDDFFRMEASASGVVEVDDATGAFALPAGRFRVETSSVFDETTPHDIIPENVQGVNVLFDSDAGDFGPSTLDGGYGGTMGTLGSFDFYGDDPVPFVMPMILDSLGQGGRDSTSILGGLIVTTVVGEAYRTGIATVDDVVVGGIEGQSISRTGFDARAADWTGALLMVAPARATIDGGALFGTDVPIFASLDITFTAAPIQGETKTEIQLKFNKPSKDKIQVKVKDWTLPAGLVPTDVTVNVGGAEFTGTLDAKGKYKSPDGRDSILLKQSKKTQLWELTLKRKNDDFAADLADEACTNADNPKPGLPVTVPLTIEVNGVAYRQDVDLVYRSKLGKKGLHPPHECRESELVRRQDL